MTAKKTDDSKRDDVLRRMLGTPPTPHLVKKRKKRAKRQSSLSSKEAK